MFKCKWLAKQLSPILGSFSDSYLKHNEDLIKYLNTVTPGKSKLISFDVSSLFTNVPLEPTLDFLKRKMPTLQHSFEIPIECIVELIELCMSKSYFQFDGVFYEQIFGIPMGSCLSPILAGLFLEHFESEILPLYAGQQPLFWKRYVDDVLSLVPEDFHLPSFMEFINSRYPTLKFTFEWESENKIPFLDVVIHNCGTYFKYSVYRKPTHSESYLHYFSYCAPSIKMGVAQSLFLRALRVCSSEYLESELSHVFGVLKSLAYPNYILNKALSKAKRVHHRTKSVPAPTSTSPKTIVVPYLPALQNRMLPLKVCNTKLVFSYKNKLGSGLSHNKPITQGGVYEIPCSSCPVIYTGETGRDLKKRIGEHKKDIVSNQMESGIVNHVVEKDHFFDFKNSKIVHPCSSIRERHVVESALISRYSKMGISANLNSGFTPHNELLSKYIREAIGLE